MNIKYNIYNQEVGCGACRGLCPSASSFATISWFRKRIISSRKKLYLTGSISLHIAWYPPNHTFVCSATDVLKYHFPSGPISSGKSAGLQCSWQNVCVTLCLFRKCQTSTHIPMSAKKGSPEARTCCLASQLVSYTRCSGLWAPGTENAFFTNTWIIVRVRLTSRQGDHSVMLTNTLDTASAPKKVARAKITPQGRTRVCSL